MKVIPPLVITVANLTSSTAAESLNAAWVIGTTYAVGTSVTYNHRDYQSLQAANVGKQPDTQAAWWVDLGPSNKWAMFDFERNTATVGASPLTAVVVPGKRVNALALFGLKADSVTITMVSASVTVYTKTVQLFSRNTATWSDYFFGELVYRESVFLFDLPPFSGASITVTLTRASGSSECQSMVIGQAVDLGFAQYGAQTDILDFSNIVRDAFGNATLVRRKNVPKMSLSVTMNKATVNKARKLREDLAAQPAVWVGIDNDTDGYFDSLAVLGIFRRFAIVVEYSAFSLCNLEIEGL
jgi:hypothetical protein